MEKENSMKIELYVTIESEGEFKNSILRRRILKIMYCIQCFTPLYITMVL